MRHGSLFSGIGGFDLAAEWMGWENVFHCDNNPFVQKVLNFYWPDAKIYDDITETDFRKYEGKIDIITGGFPCQPFSTAGRRKGSKDDRYLWPEMLRVIKEIKPRYVVGENVAGIISMVQPNSETTVESRQALFEEENKTTISENEYVVETICRDFESLGYSVQPIVIPACAVGAPHRRDRIWFIAYSECNGHNGECTDEKRQQLRTRGKARSKSSSFGGVNITADTINNGHTNGHTQRRRTFTRSEERGLCEFTEESAGIVTDTFSIGYGGRTETTGNITSGKKRTMVQRSGRNGDEVRCETERCGEVTEDTVSNGRIQREFGEKGTEIWKLRNAGTGSSIGVHLSEGVTTDTCNLRLQGGEFNGSIRSTGETETKGRQFSRSIPPNWSEFPTQPPVRSRNDGISSELVGITVSKHRIESIKAYGNAIVPQVAFEIFKVIERLENANGN